MKRNIDAVILDFEGKPVKSGAPKIKRTATGAPVFDPETSEPIVLEEEADFTMKGAFFTALGAQIEGDDKATGEQKLAQYALGMKLAAGGEVELTTEQAALLKTRCGKVFNAMTYGRIAAFLDQDPEVTTTKE